MAFNFENLDVYRKATDFVNCIYTLTKTYPKDEMFGLTSQIRRAAVSKQPTMNNEQRTTNGFTLIELMVAMGILVIILSFAGVIFNAGINTHRTAIANAEIMRKLRAITDRLDADFAGLRKDGEIFVAWVAVDRRPDFDDCDLDGFERFDRIMFFADGDFQSYKTSPLVRGNLARICYMLATRGGPGGVPAAAQPKAKRILARTQHILTADAVPLFFDPNSLVDVHWYTWNNLYEYDKMTLEQWKKMPSANKRNALSVITDVKVDVLGVPTVARAVWGAHVDPADPNSIHMLLCEGVGEFKIQGWYDAERRWVPEVDPDGDGDLTDRSDFFWLSPGVLDPDGVPRVLYPFRISVPPETYGWVNINGIGYPAALLNEANFNAIPGLGRALKFTFTLFDSKGVIKQGRTFTHIVHLD
jgi:prepilin-type N-terminal cleavage/methylation domain-containing protein